MHFCVYQVRGVSNIFEAPHEVLAVNCTAAFSPGIGLTEGGFFARLCGFASKLGKSAASVRSFGGNVPAGLARGRNHRYTGIMTGMLFSYFRSASTRALIALSVFAVLLLCARFFWSGTITFFMLMWNLFLAAIPWFVSSIVRFAPVRHPAAKWGLMVLWLLFFPNAPYILTDMIHLGQLPGAPLWFDLILLTTFSFAGLLFAFVSLRHIEQVVVLAKPVLRILFRAGLVYMACFGIYLGRFLRWNSWDVFHAPFDLLADVADRVANPLAYLPTWGFTVLLGTTLLLMYGGFVAFADETKMVPGEPSTQKAEEAADL